MLDEAEIFKALAPMLRVRPELQQVCHFGAQWASPHAPEADGWAPFHIVTRGACLLDTGDPARILLQQGDAVVLAHGGPHTIHAVPAATGPSTEIYQRRRLHDELVFKSNVDGEPDTKLICGRLRFEHAHQNMVLMALPSVVVVTCTSGRDSDRMRRIIETIQEELEEDRLGAACVAASLASSLMIFVLRAYFESASKDARHGGSGILAVLAHRQTARVLAAMLADLARDWSLDALAQKAHASRATLVRLFQVAVGMAPAKFLAELRLTVARHRILASSVAIAEIAEDVGYESETAFSRAYHRRYGVAPGADRKQTSDHNNRV